MDTITSNPISWKQADKSRSKNCQHCRTVHWKNTSILAKQKIAKFFDRRHSKWPGSKVKIHTTTSLQHKKSNWANPAVAMCTRLGGACIGFLVNLYLNDLKPEISNTILCAYVIMTRIFIKWSRTIFLDFAVCSNDKISAVMSC